MSTPALPTNTVLPEVEIGTTEWLNAQRDPPPMVGWWKCRVREPNWRRGNRRTSSEHRRWYNGFYFSAPVSFLCTDKEAEALASMPTFLPQSAIEWCGLKAPHPDPYPYVLHQREKLRVRPVQP